MDAYKKLNMFPSDWVRKMTQEEIDEARQQLKAYTISTTLEKGLKEQMCTYQAYYPPLQDLYKKLRDARREGNPVPIETITQWEELARKSDKASRERLYVLTVAAEKGWTVAGDLASAMKGNYADKLLNKALKKDEKRKEPSKDKEKAKKRPSFRGGYRNPGYPSYHPYMWQNPYQPMGMSGMPMSNVGMSTPQYGYNPRPEAKQCSYCRGSGHYFRHCPMRPTPSAAMGAPPAKGQDDKVVTNTLGSFPDTMEVIKTDEKSASKLGVKPNAFEPGLIHQQRFFAFWKETLNAPEWVLTVLRDGYEIPLQSWPDQYEERNNKSVRDNMPVVRKIMAEMILSGVVQVKVVKTKPTVVSPLGLVSKTQPDGSIKHRLVFDASRHLNKFVKVPHVRLNHLDKALEITQENDVQAVFDLTSAYYHIKIKEEHRTLLGAAFQNSDGSTVYVQYGHLPFGLASAVHIITKVWKPISQFLNGFGIRNTIYIDDGRILASSPAEMRRILLQVYETITKAGWSIEETKSDGLEEANHRKKYLGFTIDSKHMKVEATPDKLKKVTKFAQECLNMDKIPVKLLASLMGNLISLEPSHGMLVRITTRSGYALLAEHVEKFHWKGSIQASDSMRSEITFFLQQVHATNGSPIKNKNLELRIESLIPNPITKKDSIPNHPRGDEEIFVSDSSSFKTFVYNLNDDCRTELVGTFEPHQQNWSSGARELLAILWTLRQWRSTQKIRNKTIYWMTDAENVVFFLKKGSRKPLIQELIFEVAILASELQLHIEPIHLCREDPRIKLADEGSRVLDSDNWSVDLFSINELKQQFVWDIDLFADASNKTCDTFCSLYYDANAYAMDAFTISWSQFNLLWICPPVSDLIRVHNRIINTPCEGLILFPKWRTANFFSLFFDKDTPKQPFTMVKEWCPYVVQNENARHTALFGQVSFHMVVLYFNTRVNQTH